MGRIIQIAKVALAIGLIVGIVYFYFFTDPQQIKDKIHQVVEQLDELRLRNAPIFGDHDEQDEDRPTAKIQPLPANGLSYVVHTRLGNTAVYLENESPTLHSLVKIEDADTGELVAKYFVRANKKVEIEMPNGIFRVKVASGQKWYGEPYLFGASTIVNEYREPFIYGHVGQNIHYNVLRLNIRASAGENEGRFIPNREW